MRVRGAGLAAAIALALLVDAGAVHAAPIPNRIAIFAGLDKITGVITTFEVEIDKTKRFGALNVRPRVCNTRPVTEEPRTMSFVEIDENQLDGKLKRIFTGWMLAQSPGLNALEHPVFDVWLTGCRKPLKAGSAKTPAKTQGQGSSGKSDAAPKSQ